MQSAPAPYYRDKQLTFTEAVLEQLRTWPWSEMVDPDPAHSLSSAPIEFHSDMQKPWLTQELYRENSDPDTYW